MSLLDAFKALFGQSGQRMENLPGLDIHADSMGVNFFTEPAAFRGLLTGAGNPLQLAQVAVLRMLEEQGAAERIANGIRMASSVACALDEDERALLRLPGRFPGAFRAHIKGRTGHSGFRVDLTIEHDGRESPFELKGPFLSLSSRSRWLLSPAELLALQAWRDHQALTPEHRGEAANLRLVAALQTAARSGMRIDLAHFDKLDVVVPKDIGVVATRLPDGSLQLSPSLGEGSTPEVLENRWAQLDLSAEGGVMRVQNRIVLLEPKRLEAIKEVFRSRRIPRERVEEFIRTPTAFLDAALVNLELGFSARVMGVGKLEHMDFGTIDATQQDWFGLAHEGAAASPPEIIEKLVTTPEDLQQAQAAVDAARAQGADTLHFGGERVDISDRQAVDAALERARARIEDRPAAESTEEDPSEPATARVTVLLEEARQIRSELLARAERAQARREPDWAVLARQPFPHQREGIAWLGAMVGEALGDQASDMYRLQGGLLADDMGLGKTYMALVAAAEYLRLQADAGRTQKPMLVVAPLSLLENWEDEVQHTFRASPFRDIVVLQAGRELADYRDSRAPRESVQLAALIREDGSIDTADIRYALRIGPDAGARRLDMDRRLVLATYQTLRDYQLSLCRIDWGLVVFDEAQNIKNPNALQTRAAKGLKADFKLLATGTPVENSLGDFWCLVDTAQPGLLGDWQLFRDEWVKPIVQAPDDIRDRIREEIGLGLRKAVGRFMLRRTKEEQLKGLPSKTLHSGVEQATKSPSPQDPNLCAGMRGLQLARYDEALDDYRQQRASDDMRGKALAALQRLREISLHPRLRDPNILLTGSASEARALLQESAKLQLLIGLLDHVRSRGEKVILFMVTKRLQQAVKLWLDRIYQLDIHIINGDTTAVPRREDELSRKQLITDFEARQGFNVLIMSPVAAGVGLTVVGANHVVHLERHWNPAKEAQASDRVYRIGQTREVHVYLPAVTHPQFDSFDVLLDRLLRGKLMLKDAVVTSEPVREEELAKLMGL